MIRNSLKIIELSEIKEVRAYIIITKNTRVGKNKR